MARGRKKVADNDDVIIIKKYANRRLYNTRSSKYITLDYLAELTREDVEFKVVDARTGEDITHNVLTQIIMEEEANGENLLPVNFLRQIIAMYGNSMQSIVPQFLEKSMDSFKANQAQLQAALEGAMAANPFAEMTKRNMEFFKNFTPGMGMGSSSSPTSSDAAGADEEEDVDIATLKRQMAELQAKIDKMS